MEQPKIRALAAQAIVEPLDSTLRYCMMLVGLRQKNWPSHEETLLITNYIENYYGGHTVGEIRLAFEMALHGDFPGVDYHPYENFSVEYFSQIMNAYRTWAEELPQRLLPPPPVPEPPVWQIDLEYAIYIMRLKDKKLKPPLTMRPHIINFYT